MEKVTTGSVVIEWIGILCSKMVTIMHNLFIIIIIKKHTVSIGIGKIILTPKRNATPIFNFNNSLLTILNCMISYTFLSNPKLTELGHTTCSWVRKTSILQSQAYASAED